MTVCAQDDTRSPHQPSGKQSYKYESFGCFYTRTTGIWQTVWLEWVDPCYIKEVYLTPRASEGTLDVRVVTSVPCTLKAAASYKGAAMGSVSAKSDGCAAQATITLIEKHLWNVGEPELYDLGLILEKDGKQVDTQLTDVEQEQNGLYTYDRKPKFPTEVIRAINSQKAACEE